MPKNSQKVVIKPQMEAMLILPISYLHNNAVKGLVFLNHNPT